MKTRDIKIDLVDCPKCGQEIRVGRGICYHCNCHIYWNNQGTPSIRRDLLRWPLDAQVVFRSGDRTIPILECADPQTTVKELLGHQETVRITGQSGEYYHIRGGYVHFHNVDSIVWQPHKRAATNAVVNEKGEGVSILDAPQWPANVLRTMNPGDRIYIHETHGDYYRIGVNEWVHSAYVSPD